MAADTAIAIFDDVLERGSPPRWRVGAGAAIVLVLVAAAVAVAMAALRPSGAMTLPAPATAAPSAGPFGAVASGGSSSPTASATLIVHVLGAVRAPGVYELPAGSRLVDAVAAAGGLADDADPSLVNLARTLVDGEQARIPRLGEPAPSDSAPSEPAAGAGGGGAGVAGGAGSGAGAGASDGPPGTASALVDLNTATQAELETLPRIGPAMAQRILDYRSQHGGFGSVEELRNVTGIGDATYEQLAPLVTV